MNMKKKKIYAVYFAYSKYEVLPEEEYDNNPMYPAGIARVLRYKTAGEQLHAYANTCCAASQMFEADSEEEYLEKVQEFKEHFSDEEWLKTNIDPFV